MTVKAHLIPAEGLVVREPNGKQLPAEGKSVELTPYWHRRIKDGDVTKGKKPSATSTSTSKKKD